MTLAYGWRLLCLAAAVFFLVHLAVGAVVALASRWAVHGAGRLDPRRAARLILLLRLLPSSLASLAVLALCLPSYLWLEPGASIERVGFTALSAAALGLVILVLAAVRAWRAAIRTRRLLESGLPCIAHAGFLRPEFIVSPAARRSLTPEQLAAALDHERAHWHSHDNLKRLLLTLAPGLLPGFTGFCTLETAWARFTEWAADDSAAAGNHLRSLSLAGALIRVARLQSAPPLSLATSLLGDTPDLPVRISRLLHNVSADHLDAGTHSARRSALWVSLAAILAALLWNPVTLTLAHRLFEHLMD